MCEGITPVEELSLANATYLCLRCHNLSAMDVIDSKIQKLIADEQVLTKRFVETQIVVDNQKAKYEKFQGDKEQARTFEDLR